MKSLRQRLALYVITDEREDRDALLRSCEAALRGGAGAIQLRRKRDHGRSLIELGRQLRTLTIKYRALYLVNDRVDVALVTEADGVHIGQDDMPLKDARGLLGDKIIGVSTRTLDEAQKAIRDGSDYLGIGAIFASASKNDADIVGLTGLRTLTSALRSIPLVAIGGISMANAERVLDAGADGLAVISAVMSAEDPEEAARSLFQCIEVRRRHQ